MLAGGLSIPLRGSDCRVSLVDNNRIIPGNFVQTAGNLEKVISQGAMMALNTSQRLPRLREDPPPGLFEGRSLECR